MSRFAADLLTGFVRKVKARMLRRQGPPIIQPYRDLARLLRKEVVLAENASWLFRATPYLIFAATWVAAALVPTFASGLLFSWSADLIAIIALLASARFFLALAGMEIGTAFGGGLTKAEADMLKRDAPPRAQILGMITGGLAAVKANSPADAPAYRMLVTNVATRTAEASKEGDFLGIGGTRVTREEEAALADIKAALT